MNSIVRRIAASATLTVAPAIIALGAASTSHAETAPTDPGTTVHSQVTVGKPGINSPTVQPVGRHHRHHYHYWG